MTCTTCFAEVDTEAVVCVHCGVALQPANPQSAPSESLNPDAHLEGLSGWLILVAITLVISPFRVIRSILGVNLPFLMNPKYQPFLEKHPAYHGLILFEVATNICYLAVAMALLYLFFKKKKVFPGYMILYLVFHLVVHFGVIFASHALLHSTKFALQSRADMFGTLLGAAIWIPYFLVSRRVKVTFVN